MKISVVGTGYVGLVAGVCFADVGHNVLCIDNNAEKVDALRKGRIPIYEPGLSDILENCQSRIDFDTDIARASQETDVIFIAVGTPETEDGSADMGPTKSVLKGICENAKTKKFIVLKSTVPVGTAKALTQSISEMTDVPHEIINNPEFLKEGAAIDDFLKPDRVVIGCKTEEARSIMSELYLPFVKNGHPIFFMSNVSAELTKYAANSFLSVKISFANELARLADEMGADFNDVRKGFTSDRRINPSFFYPGIGYGGSCFPKDVQALIKTAKDNNSTMDVVESADQVNDRQKLLLFHKINSHFQQDLKGKTIAVWGLSFKPRTDDVREAPAKYVISALVEAGAKVVAYDPVAHRTAKSYFPADFEILGSAIEAAEGADALAIMTEWNEFRNPNFETLKQTMKRPLIFDGRNALHVPDVLKHGFEYYCVGRQILIKKESSV